MAFGQKMAVCLELFLELLEGVLLGHGEVAQTARCRLVVGVSYARGELARASRLCHNVVLDLALNW